jgi:hypothetical protein
MCQYPGERHHVTTGSGWSVDQDHRDAPISSDARAWIVPSQTSYSRRSGRS